MTSDIISEDIRNQVRVLATEAVKYTEPICIDCLENGKNDPLGIHSGVNTQFNKSINSLVDEVVDQHEEADSMWESDIRSELVILFLEQWQQGVSDSDFLVQDSLECVSCYRDKQKRHNDDEIPLRVKDTDTGAVDMDEWM